MLADKGGWAKKSGGVCCLAARKGVQRRTTRFQNTKNKKGKIGDRSGRGMGGKESLRAAWVGEETERRSCGSDGKSHFL